MSFQVVRGQEQAVAMLRADLAQRAVPAAYLLAGPDGVGKRLLALQLAKALNCDAGGTDACDRCPACLKTDGRTHPDVWWVEPATARDLIKIEQVRAFLPRVGLRPYEGRHQLLILVGAEQLTDEAANALLKTLEEPAQATRFILTAANRAACLPTIVSRCRLVPCRRLPQPLIVERLLADHGLPRAQAETLARWADGSLGRALECHRKGWWERQQDLERMIQQGQWQALAAAMPAGEQARPWVQETLELLVWSYRQRALAATADDAPEAAAAHAACVERLLRLWTSVNLYANAKLAWALALDDLQAPPRAVAFHD